MTVEEHNHEKTDEHLKEMIMDLQIENRKLKTELALYKSQAGN